MDNSFQGRSQNCSSSAPRKPRPTSPIPCPKCGQEIEPTALIQPEGFCSTCWRKAWEDHQHYRQDKAILVAEAEPCVWTEDLFRSELILEQDGCYFQTVRWTDASRQPHQAEQLECFEVKAWQHILTEAQALQQIYQTPHPIDDVEVQSIWLRVGDELLEMRSQQRWHDQPQSIRFQAIWNQLHSKSPWLARLQII